MVNLLKQIFCCIFAVIIETGTISTHLISRALIIDDDEVSCQIFKLQNQRHRLVRSLNFCHYSTLAIEELHQLRKENQLPDIILLDINMPELNGWDILEALNKEEILKNIPVYMLSSSVSQKDIQKSETYSQVKGFFSKPMNFERMRKLWEEL